jgi:hypothetical protein
MYMHGVDKKLKEELIISCNWMFEYWYVFSWQRFFLCFPYTPISCGQLSCNFIFIYIHYVGTWIHQFPWNRFL